MNHAQRHFALLGGTTTWGDFLHVAQRLMLPVRLANGPAVQRFEQRLAGTVACRFATTFSAGRVGLYGLLGIGPGDEVLVPVPTHVVVPNAVRYRGATPVFVDCRLTDYNLDLTCAAQAITPRTRAMIVQHTFGFPADLDSALTLAGRHDLAVIEDCVHALGATYQDRPVGAFGRAAFFSTEETKVVSTTMGGAVTTNDEGLHQALRRFAAECHAPGFWLVYRFLLKLALYHFLTQPRVHRFARAAYDAFGRRLPQPRPTTPAELIGERPAGYLTRFGNAQAEIGLRQLDGLAANLAHRRKIAAIYADHLLRWGLRPPSGEAAASPSFVRYPLWVSGRSEAEKRYRRHGVLGTWFTSVVEEAIDPRRLGYAHGSCPRAEIAAAHLINLPTHFRVTAADAARLITVVRDLLTVPTRTP